jgi:hypothetical protein
MKNMNNNICKSTMASNLGYNDQAKDNMSAPATLNGQYVTGVSDAESTFVVKISRDSRTVTG